jgi:hypothetical protein
MKTTTTVQITSPVLPNEAMKSLLSERIKALVPKGDCNIGFYNSGFDSFGQLKFDVFVMDSDRHELDDLRNTIITELFSVLFQNTK